MCHLLLVGLQLLALSAFWFLPWPVALPTFAVLIAATLALYAYLVKGARRPVMTGIEGMRNALGRVRSVQDGAVTIWVNSELWSARSREELHEGDRVQVTGVDGLVLRVRRVGLATRPAQELQATRPLRAGRV